jgi:hypothetical protein
MKRLSVILCCLALLLPMLAFSQTRVFHREYLYQASEDDGRNQARKKAIKEAQKLLLEDVGIIVESRQQLIAESTGGELSEYFRKEINTYTLGKVSTTIIPETEKWDGSTYFAKFAMEVDTAAIYKYLDDIIKQKEQARADSLKKSREISDLQLAVEAARNSLEKEQGRENPLKIENDKKERQLKLAEMEKNNAQNALDRALNTRPVNTIRIESERKIHEDAERNYSKALTEYNIAYSNWDAARKRIEAARKKLHTAEGNLAKAIGVDGGNGTANKLEKDVDYILDYNDFGFKNANAENGLGNKKEYSKGNNTLWAVALNLVGLALIYAGYEQNNKMVELYNEYYVSGEAWNKVESAKTARNALYIAGGLSFALGVYLWF